MNDMDTDSEKVNKNENINESQLMIKEEQPTLEQIIDELTMSEESTWNDFPDARTAREKTMQFYATKKYDQRIYLAKENFDKPQEYIINNEIRLGCSLVQSIGTTIFEKISQGKSHYDFDSNVLKWNFPTCNEVLPKKEHDPKDIIRISHDFTSLTKEEFEKKYEKKINSNIPEEVFHRINCGCPIEPFDVIYSMKYKFIDKGYRVKESICGSYKNIVEPNSAFKTNSFSIHW